VEKIDEEDLYIELCHLLHRALELIKAPGMCTYHRAERQYESALEHIFEAQEKVQQIIRLKELEK
jgi:hypothetical protein